MTQKPSASRFRRWIYLILGAVAIGLGVGLTIKLALDHQQRIACAAAEEYAQRTQPLLAVDPRFKNVLIEKFSGFGCVRISGTVASDDELAALHKFIDAAPPPNNVMAIWPVKIAPGTPATNEESSKP